MKEKHSPHTQGGLSQFYQGKPGRKGQNPSFPGRATIGFHHRGGPSKRGRDEGPRLGLASLGCAKGGRGRKNDIPLERGKDCMLINAHAHAG